jgi:hypothetical protein
MLKKVDNNRILSLNSAREQYPKSKILFLITDMSDMSDIQGTVFMVSDDNTSFNELCDENDKLKEQGKQTIIIGSYENGGGIGVQYELQQ